VTLRYEKLARRDLRQIWLACAQASGITIADKLIVRIEDTLAKTLGAFPQSGRLRPELGAGVRSFPVLPYVAFYRVAASRVELLRVIHGHRDIKPPLVSLLLAS
jgi:toxin ParE1/3/4